MKVVGTSLLVFSVAAIADPNNAGTPKYLIPLALVPMLVGILSAFGLNSGAAINSALDMSGRVFALTIYGTELLRYRNSLFETQDKFHK